MPTSTPKKEIKPRKLTVLMSGKFYSVPVIIDEKFITIKLPKKVADYLDLEKNELFWSPVNGVIQLSGTEPHMSIPMMSITADRFIAQ